MNIERIKSKFKEYVENYDMNDEKIILKLNHTYRVMDFCAAIAKENNFNDKDTEIAILTGLLHDYARFEQWTNYKTFSDLDSVDHGDLAVEKLFDNNEIVDYCLNKEYYDEIYDAIKYHNKFSYPEDLSERNKLHCKVIRDPDKIDILYQHSIKPYLFIQDEAEISEKIRKDFFNNKQLDRRDVKSKNDDILLYIAMIFDLNFKYSFRYIKYENLIDKLYNKIKDKDKFKEYFDYIKNYIDERIG